MNIIQNHYVNLEKTLLTILATQPAAAEAILNSLDE